MKHRFLVLLFLFIHAFLFAQSGKDSTINNNCYTFRLLIGVNQSMMDKFDPYYDDYESETPRFLTGGNFGISFDYRMFKILKFGLGAQISNYGGSFFSSSVFYSTPPKYIERTDAEGIITHNFRMTYFEIPFTFKVSIPSKSISPFFEGGISYARLSNAYYYINNGGGINVALYTPGTLRSNITELVEKNNFYYLIGTGITFRTEKKIDFQLTYRYSNSITRVFAYDLLERRDPKTDKLIESYDMVSHLRAFQLFFSTGYNF